MRNKIIYSTILLSLMSYNSHASSYFNKQYAGLNFAWSKIAKYKSGSNIYMNSKQANSYMIGATVGTFVNDNFRTDLEVNKLFNVNYKLQRLSYSPTTTRSYSFSIKLINTMLSGYYDIDINSNYIKPFIGLGAGLSTLKGHFSILDIDTNTGIYSISNTNFTSKRNFAYKLACGFSVRLSEKARIDLAYNFTHNGSINFENVVLINPTPKLRALKTHSILFGPRIEF